jgi:hypothetical protein
LLQQPQGFFISCSHLSVFRIFGQPQNNSFCIFSVNPYNARMKQQETEKRPRGRPSTGRMPQHQFRCPDDEWKLFEQAAEADGLTVATWLRRLALKAARRRIAEQ